MSLMNKYFTDDRELICCHAVMDWLRFKHFFSYNWLPWCWLSWQGSFIHFQSIVQLSNCTAIAIVPKPVKCKSIIDTVTFNWFGDDCNCSAIGQLNYWLQTNERTLSCCGIWCAMESMFCAFADKSPAVQPSAKSAVSSGAAHATAGNFSVCHLKVRGNWKIDDAMQGSLVVSHVS